MQTKIRYECNNEAESVIKQLSEAVQKKVTLSLIQLVQPSYSAYQRRPEGLEVIRMVSHMQDLKENLWLEFTTEYAVDEQGPILRVASIRKTSAAEALKQKLNSLEQLKNIHVELAQKMIEADGRNMYPFDLFATAVYKRSMSLIDGFSKMIPSNFICAAPLLRLQIDNLLRYHAASRVNGDVDEFAKAIMRGIMIKDMRDKDKPKQRLTDAHLVQTFSRSEPRIASLYKETSGYIHLSEKHIYNAIGLNKKGDSRLQVCISESDQFITDEERIEATTAMIIITEKLLWLLNSCNFVKNNPLLTREALERGEEFLIN